MNDTTSVPQPSELGYPAELPVVAHHDEILDALRNSRVVIVCGDTGSGKTTQLPKIALEAGCAARNRRIACTQPRRLAAVTTAERVARELGGEVGGTVGYQHRYGRALSPTTRVKFMTDGVLLAETRADPLLLRYDCVIVDEAHERSLNIDFLLGILKRLLTRRLDLKVIVSSATLDTERFSVFFDRAPVIAIPGRLHPVETRYFFREEDTDRDLPIDVARAVDTLPTDGDALVFLPGERDIRECARELEARRGRRDDVIPLIASLPAAEQRRAFLPSPRRRIILATNVAETSLTIPGVRYVIDSGLARISRYVHRTQVQRLQIEPISKASARQRAGRCGRIGPGICVRLYSEADFLAREDYTPPEILRSSLAGVILTMLDLRLGDVADFPFIEPPRPAMIAEGFRELLELGAVTRDARGEPALTPIGRQLARIPIEPRLARMLIAASDFAVLPAAIPVVAAMSCDDPRRRPAEERDKARQQHAKFRVAGSDFLGTLRLWNWWRARSEELSQTKLRRLCTETYLSYPRMREWADLVRQLRRLAGELGLDLANDGGDEASLHRALLTGLLGRIGRYDPEEREYRGARGVRFVIHPSSVLATRPRRAERRGAQTEGERTREPAIPEWVMCGELVDTTRLYAREVTAVDAGWIEAAAGQLCRHHVHSPEWDGRSGFVRATEQVTLYGLVIVPARRCDYSRTAPDEARAIFIRRGILDGDFPQPPPEVRANIALAGGIRRLAEKLRRPGLYDEDGLARALDAAMPRGICSAPALRKWLRAAGPDERGAFRLRREDWWPDVGEEDDGFPDSIRIGDCTLELDYRHAPDDPETDGITCTVRKSRAAALRLWRSDWLVPGVLPEKLSWMLSVLPTVQRKVLAPLSDAVTRLLGRLTPGSEPLEDAVVRAVRAEFGLAVQSEAWRRAKPPARLRVRFRILDDEDGRPLAVSRDLDEALATAGVADCGDSIACRENGEPPSVHVTWDFGTIPETASGSRAGWRLEHYPALHDEGDGVTLRLYADAAEAVRVHAAGVRRLYLLALGAAAKTAFPVRGLPLAAKAFMREMKLAADAMAEDCLAGAAAATLVRDRPPVRTAEEFARRLETGRGELVKTQREITALAAAAITGGAELLDRIETDAGIPEETAESVQTALVWLFLPGFVRTTPLAFLRRYPVYLRGLEVRLERARNGRASDLAKEARFAPLWARYRDALADRSRTRPAPETLERFRWLLEEYRISVFAQELRTAESVSEKRLDLILPPR